MSQKVFITGKIPEIAYELLQEHFEVTMNHSLEPLSKEEIIAGLQGKDALLSILSDDIDRAVIESNPDLKIIANYGAGFNNVDIDAATEYEIPVTNTPKVSNKSTAELTIGLMISVARRMVEGDKEVRRGDFSGWAPLYFLGTELSGKTIGIMGMGSIGQEVAKRAASFDMNIIYYDLKPLEKWKEKKLNCQYQPFERLLREADFLSLHVNYNESLKHLISQKELALMKPNSYLINAARGPLVKERDLVQALKDGEIAGAALDVFEFEPEIGEALKQLDNVVLTPHIGNATVEARGDMARLCADNIINVLKGKMPISCVNEEIYSEYERKIFNPGGL